MLISVALQPPAQHEDTAEHPAHTSARQVTQQGALERGNVRMHKSKTSKHVQSQVAVVLAVMPSAVTVHTYSEQVISVAALWSRAAPKLP